ncbi:MAG: hypothetical protein P1U46_04605 [Patescibacteria group bacterium]|nr:hypothetical protein [Patescibacteria group bacterium]
MHNKINKLNLNLEKNLDQVKTEYNALLNKQKDFISIASHEIKTPIMASSMQIDSIVDDFED